MILLQNMIMVKFLCLFEFVLGINLKVCIPSPVSALLYTESQSHSPSKVLQIRTGFFTLISLPTFYFFFFFKICKNSYFFQKISKKVLRLTLQNSTKNCNTKDKKEKKNQLTSSKDFFISVEQGKSLNPERWKITLKMHLNTICIAFWKISESWNLAVARKAPPMFLINGKKESLKKRTTWKAHKRCIKNSQQHETFNQRCALASTTKIPQQPFSSCIFFPWAVVGENSNRGIHCHTERSMKCWMIKKKSN